MRKCVRRTRLFEYSGGNFNSKKTTIYENCDNAQKTDTKNSRVYSKCFPVNIARYLRTAFLKNICEGCFWHAANESLVINNENFVELAPGEDRETRHILFEEKCEELAFPNIFFKGKSGYTFPREHYLKPTKYFS